jgi:FkbM family methyltransferase
VNVIRNPQLFVKKAVGKVHRKLVTAPDHLVTVEMRGGVRFEHKRLSFLEEDDIRAMLTHSYEITVCDCFRRHLSPGDIVLDVGANIGYMSAVAASYVGTSGEVHGFEPLLECFQRLDVLRNLNPAFRLVFHNVAVGAEQGSMPIAFNPEGDMRNATLVPGKQRPHTRTVPVWRLDDYIAENIDSPERIRMIKVDVEGFEFSVLQGLERFFAGRRSKPLIICEVKPWEIRNLGYTMQDFVIYMKRFGYQAYDMLQERKPVDIAALDDMETFLFRAN